MHINGPSTNETSSNRNNRSREGVSSNSVGGGGGGSVGNQHFNSQIPIENGIDFRHTTSHNTSIGSNSSSAR